MSSKTKIVLGHVSFFFFFFFLSLGYFRRNLLVFYVGR